MLYFVSGITGHVGGAAARTLLEQGHQLRSLSRDPSKAGEWTQKGVDVRQGEFTDAAAVASAMEGVDGAFLMLPPFMAPEPGFPEARAMIAGLVEALQTAPPPRLVVLSSIGSQQKHGLGMITSTHLMEEALGDPPFPTAFVRAGSFLENYAHSLPSAAETGIFHSFWVPTDRPYPMIASADIGAEVAKLLAGEWAGRRIIELGTRRTPDELAAAMAEVLGRPVEAKAVPREQWPAVLAEMGFPPRGVLMYAEMVDGCNSGWIDFGEPGTESVAGTTTPAEVFVKANDAWA